MPTIAEIEQGCLDLLSEKWAGFCSTPIGKFDVGGDYEDILATPSIAAAVEKIGFRSVDNDGGIELAPIVSLYLAFKNVGKPDQRRKGIYPIVTAVAGILTGQKLGLDIEPLAPAGPIVEIFHVTLKEKGLIGFRIDLQTAYDIEMADFSAVGANLLLSAVDYYRQDPAQAAADASDLITLDGRG